jgi:hypothetical protein
MEATKEILHNLESLQRRKAELNILCKEKEKEIGEHLDYIGNNLGPIAIRSFFSTKWKKESGTKAEIISVLVAEGVDAAMEIQQDPHNIKDKLVNFVKKSASGIISLLIKGE